ncbi:MAG: decaprenyl-phosphate phosphoribosyltransferase [bacterium]|jgi:4-hydroxybenzoate polyprenyltransferase
MEYFKLIRIHQWVKNLLIFAPLFFSFNYNINIFIKLVLVFFIFSIVASGVYIINDIIDLENDKNHPDKKNRPLASGKISINIAIFITFLLFGFSFFVSFLFNKILFYLILIYLIINLLYSVVIKKIVIWDVIFLALNYIIRLLVGSLPFNIELSNWIIINTFLLAILIVFSKRRDDLILFYKGKNTRKNIHNYSLELINISISIVGGLSIVSYLMYVTNIKTIEKHGQYLYITFIFVLVGIIRYLQIIYKDESNGDPSKIFIKDNFLKITILLWLIIFYILHYLNTINFFNL